MDVEAIKNVNPGQADYPYLKTFTRRKVSPPARESLERRYGNPPTRATLAPL